MRASQRFGSFWDVGGFFLFLHDDALRAAAGALARLAHVHLALWCAGAERAGAGWV